MIDRAVFPFGILARARATGGMVCQIYERSSADRIFLVVIFFHLSLMRFLPFSEEQVFFLLLSLSHISIASGEATRVSTGAARQLGFILEDGFFRRKPRLGGGIGKRDLPTLSLTHTHTYIYIRQYSIENNL